MRASRLLPLLALTTIAFAGPVAAQSLPAAAARLCLRNVAATVTCYVVGRAGELMVDGTLSAAWAKVMDAPKAGDAKLPPPAPHSGPPAPKPPPATMGLSRYNIDLLRSDELGSLSARLARQGLVSSDPKAKPVDGFVVFPGAAGAVKSQAAGTKLDPNLASDLSLRLRMLQSTSSPSTLQILGCRSERETKLGLDYPRILTTTTGDELSRLLARRQKEVVEHCAGPTKP